MKKPTIAELMAEIDALKREVAELKRMPIHHFHHVQQPNSIGWPRVVPFQTEPYKPYITCGQSGNC